MALVSGSRVETGSLGPAHWLAVALVLATGLIHVYAGVIEGRAPVTLAGVGFLGAVVLFLLDYRRRLLYAVGVLYTVIQIPLWYVVKAGEYTAIGYVDKSIQVLLVLLLVYLFWRGRDANSSARESVAT